MSAASPRIDAGALPIFRITTMKTIVTMNGNKMIIPRNADNHFIHTLPLSTQWQTTSVHMSQETVTTCYVHSLFG